ncbi:alpha/beta hydrolase [Plantactinospora siamensis]|uniref:Alpha/beta hydrolase n=1 Tax=Plantactinospora siamensis TaxID=555372 RepID=A0ABV6NV49_9ACTN
MVERNAIVLPGGRYGPYAPLLTYAATAAERRGAHIHPVTWGGDGWDPNGPPPNAPKIPLADRMPWLHRQVTPVLDRLAAHRPAAHGVAADGPAADGPAADGPTADGSAADGSAVGGPTADGPSAVGRRPLLIGKSLGTLAAPLAAERGLPAVWLTPLLRVGPVVEALRRATAPMLLVGGTADHTHWDGALARTLSSHVLEIPDADHGLLVPGPLARSAAVLGQVAAAVEEFLDDVVWP